jgi:phosphohistidine phosphatase
MKTLIIIRHAKSSWKHNVIDHERPLNNRGVSDSKMVSNYFINKGLNPDKVMISDSNRTKLTADQFIKALKIDSQIIEYSHELYDFSGYNLINTIKNCNYEVDRLMVFGHNHAITAFVNSYGDKYIENVPTCGVVIIEFEIKNWKDLKPGKTIDTLFPRDLKQNI